MNSPADSRIDNYLNALREGLSDMSALEREEIVREINVHIRECAEEPNINVEAILQRLGSPESLASHYRQELLIRNASRSISPLLILRSTLQLAKRGTEGIVLFMGALFGYALGGGLVLTGVLKPIFPRQTGLWVGPGVFDFGIHEPRYSDPVREVLGWWYIPAALCLGCFFLWLTTYGIRWFLRRSKRLGPIFPRRQLGIRANAGLLILLALFLVVGLNVGTKHPKSHPQQFPLMTETQLGGLTAKSQHLLVLINITRTPGGALRLHFDFYKGP